MLGLPEDVLKAFIAEHHLSQADLLELSKMLSSKQTPNKEIVGVREFVLSPHYMNAVGPDGQPVLYPKVMDYLEEVSCGEYDQAVMTGGIGSAKTTIALYALAYQVYLLSCYDHPHTMFGLDPSSEILVIFQSMNAKVAADVDYSRFRAMLKRSPYFKKHFPFNPHLESEMQFPNRIIARPMTGSEHSAIGQNVIGGLVDEVNFMDVIEKSKRSKDQGVYDQAQAIYDGLDRRRKSRFMQGGKLPGILFLSSSKRYPGEFTDRLIEDRDKEIARDGRSSTYVYDKRVWDIKPEGTYCGDTFDVFAGDMYRKPRILAPNEQVHESDQKLVVEVPVEYRTSFEKDIMGSLRDIAGVSTLARFPFIMDSESISLSMGRAKSVFSREDTDFVSTPLKLFKQNIINPHMPRFAHIDLSISGDSTGVVLGHVTGFTSVQKAHEEKVANELMPVIYIDGALEVKAPKGGEINYQKVRRIFYLLRAMGMNVLWVTLDGFQSHDTMQLMRQQGFVTGYQSMDAKPWIAYEFLKSALYEDRVRIPQHTKLHLELASLERDPKTGRIDHPTPGSKDIGDALAGVVYGLTMRRENWSHYNVPINAIPGSVVKALKDESQDKK